MKKKILFVLFGMSTLFSFGQNRERVNDNLISQKVKISGHSHNDYLQNKPFFEAYNAGMESIEADVFLRNGVLYTAHDKSDIDTANTLEKLYFEPIKAQIKKNKGYVFKDSTKRLQLLIDIKEDYHTALTAVKVLCERYLDVVDGKSNPAAIKIVISGDRPLPPDFDEYPEWIYFDGILGQRYSEQQLARVALFSENIQKFTKWDGKNELKEEDKNKIKEVIKFVNSLDKPFRFWGCPDNPRVWRELSKLGVYWINTDHPKALSYFIERKKQKTSIQFTY